MQRIGRNTFRLSFIGHTCITVSSDILASHIPKYTCHWRQMTQHGLSSSSSSSSTILSTSQPWKSIPVKAYYVGNSIDVVKTTNTNSAYTGMYVHIYLYYLLHTLYWYLFISCMYSLYIEMAFQFQSKSITITINQERQEFISIFKYGSVVFFNVAEDQHSNHIQNIRRVAMDKSISDALQHTEQYDLYVDRCIKL